MPVLGLTLSSKLKLGWFYDWFVALPSGVRIAIVFALATYAAMVLTQISSTSE